MTILLQNTNYYDVLSKNVLILLLVISVLYFWQNYLNFLVIWANDRGFHLNFSKRHSMSFYRTHELLLDYYYLIVVYLWIISTKITNVSLLIAHFDGVLLVRVLFCLFISYTRPARDNWSKTAIIIHRGRL